MDYPFGSLGPGTDGIHPVAQFESSASNLEHLDYFSEFALPQISNNSIILDETLLASAGFTPSIGDAFVPSLPNLLHRDVSLSGAAIQNSTLAHDAPWQEPSLSNGGVSGSYTAPHMQMAPPVSCTQPPQPQARRRIRTEDWMAQRDRIKSSYIDQGLTLLETIKLMETIHGFFASEKKYKEKIKEWGFDKNLSQRQSKFIRRKARGRLNDGKKTIFSVRGNLIPANKIERHYKTKSLNMDSVTGATPSEIEYKSPSLQQTPPRPNPQNTVGVSDSGVPSVAHDIQSILRLTWNGYNMEGLKALHHRAVHLGEQHQDADARVAFAEAIDGLEALMGPTHHSTMSVLSSFVEFCVQRDYLDEAEHRRRKSVIDHQNHFGEKHFKTFQSMARLGLFYKSQKRYGESELLLIRAREGLESLPQHDSEDTFCNTQNIVLGLIQIFQSQGEFKRAEQEYSTLIAKAEALKEPYQKTCIGLKHDLSHLYIDWIWHEHKIDSDDFEMTMPYLRAERILLELVEYSERYWDLRTIDICPLETLRAHYHRLEENDKLEKLLVRIENLLASAPKHHIIFTEESKEKLFDLKSGIARSYAKLQRHDVAEWWFMHVQETVEADFGPESYLAYKSVLQTALFYLNQGQWEEAEPLFKNAFARADKVLEDDDPVKARIAGCLKTKRFEASCLECGIN